MTFKSNIHGSGISSWCVVWMVHMIWMVHFIEKYIHGIFCQGTLFDISCLFSQGKTCSIFISCLLEKLAYFKPTDYVRLHKTGWFVFWRIKSSLIWVPRSGKNLCYKFLPHLATFQYNVQGKDAEFSSKHPHPHPTIEAENSSSTLSTYICPSKVPNFNDIIKSSGKRRP